MGEDGRRVFIFSPVLSSLMSRQSRSHEGLCVETCASCTHDEQPGLRLCCHDRDAGMRCHAHVYSQSMFASYLIAWSDLLQRNSLARQQIWSLKPPPFFLPRACQAFILTKYFPNALGGPAKEVRADQVHSHAQVSEHKFLNYLKAISILWPAQAAFMSREDTAHLSRCGITAVPTWSHFDCVYVLK